MALFLLPSSSFLQSQSTVASNVHSNPTLSVRIDDDYPTRTTSSLVLSCLFTMFFSILCLIRTDFPSPMDSRWRRYRTKLNIVFWALVSPELILFWSLRQWYEARKIAKEFKSRGWTTAHGMFMVMGGFMLYKDDRPVQTLSIQRFRTLLRLGAIEFPIISAAQIQSYSTLHPILSFLVILQVLWFAIECISRLAYGLVITQLEVVTLALVVLLGTTQLFWWHKPLDATCPMRIDARTETRRMFPDVTPRSVRDDFNREHAFSRDFKLLSLGPLSWQTKPRNLSYVGRLGNFIGHATIVWPLASLYRDVGRLAISIQAGDVRDNALSTPLFYAPDTTDYLQFGLLPCIFIGMGFNAIPTLFYPSTSLFPTETLQTMWRVASLGTAGFSAVTLVSLLIILGTQLWSQWAPHAFLVEIIANIFVYTGICLFLLTFVFYVVARLLVFVLSLACLARLPEAALVIVGWTNYIPHFG